jgi:hypothetical protein
MEQCGVQAVPPPQGFYNGGHSNFFTAEAWRSFNGFCGHVNVPENYERWDPGDFPWDRFARLLTGEGGGFLMALTNDEQRELLNKVRDLRGDPKRDGSVSYANQQIEQIKEALDSDQDESLPERIDRRLDGIEKRLGAIEAKLARE